MLQRTATLTLLVLGLFALSGALGCSSGQSPVLPDSESNVVATDTTGGQGDKEAAGGAFTGVLTDPDGDPLAWAELYIDGELAGWTEEDGSFTIYGIEDEEAEFVLEARIDDEVVYTKIISPAERSAQEYGDGDPNTERGLVWGFVHDQFGPVPHALVVVFNKNENFGVDFSDDHGRYEIPDAPAGKCAIVGFAPEHATGKGLVFVIADGEVQKNLFLPKKLDFGIVGGLVVTGPLYDAKPIPHARVALKSADAPEDAPPIVAFTNKHGVYVMAPVPLGPAGMRADAVCFNEATRPVHVHPGRNFQSFHLEPAGCGGVEGRVTDPDDQPIPYAKVRVSHEKPDGEIWQKVEFTGPLGFYRINPLIPAEYRLDCGKQGFEPFQQMVQVFPDQFTVVDIILQPKEDDPGG